MREYCSGIPKPELERVFEPFLRPELSRNCGGGSVGPGLSIARNIARGTGTEITLRDPAAKPGLIAELVLPHVPAAAA